MPGDIPKSMYYRMPAEWYRHSATQLHWPSNRETWPGKHLQKVEQVYCNIIETLHQYESIHLFVEDEGIFEHAHSLLQKEDINFEQLRFHIQKINDVWARDCGPIFVVRNDDEHPEFAITDWQYNAWGQKYPPYEDDNQLPRYVSDTFGINRFEPGMVLEGGAIDTNGDGVLLTTESVLLNGNRNPGLSKEDIEQRLISYLGVEKVIWLKKGLAGDDTDGHIDDLARFLNNDTIVASISDDPNDVNYDALQKNLELLLKATDQYGHSFTIELLPLPQTKLAGTTVDGSEYVPASYTNFYIANGVVLVPTYDDRYDQKALELFERYFPDRDVVGIPSRDLVWGQGAIHCITQQWYGI